MSENPRALAARRRATTLGVSFIPREVVDLHPSRPPLPTEFGADS